MSLLERLLPRRREAPPADAAHRLYGTAVAQARCPGFFELGGVADTVDGRFDMVALHVFLLLHRLKSDHGHARNLAQAVFDLLFADMDRNLREMGVSDLSVGRKVKGMVSAFYGRVAAYDAALAPAAEAAALEEALARNLFRRTAPDPARLAALAAYVRREARTLASTPVEKLLAGEMVFGPPLGEDES